MKSIRQISRNDIANKNLKSLGKINLREEIVGYLANVCGKLRCAAECSAGADCSGFAILMDEECVCYMISRGQIERVMVSGKGEGKQGTSKLINYGYRTR